MKKKLFLSLFLSALLVSSAHADVVSTELPSPSTILDIVLAFALILGVYLFTSYLIKKFRNKK